MIRNVKIHIIAFGIFISILALVFMGWTGYHLANIIFDHPAVLVYGFLLLLVLEGYLMLYAILKRKFFDS